MFTTSVGCLRHECSHYRYCQQCFDEITEYDFNEIDGPGKCLYPNMMTNAYLIRLWVNEEGNQLLAKYSP